MTNKEKHEAVILRNFRNPLGEITLFKFHGKIPYSISVDCPKIQITKWIDYVFKQNAIETFQFYVFWLDSQYKENGGENE